MKSTRITFRRKREHLKSSVPPWEHLKLFKMPFSFTKKMTLVMTPPSKKNEKSISLSSFKTESFQVCFISSFRGPWFILQVEVISTPPSNPSMPTSLVYLYMGVSKNRGTPKWMVKIMENPIKMDDLGVPLFSETPI